MKWHKFNVVTKAIDNAEWHAAFELFVAKPAVALNDPQSRDKQTHPSDWLTFRRVSKA